MIGLAIKATLHGTATRSQPYWIEECGLRSAGEPSCLSRNGVSGAAGKLLVMKRFMDGKGGGRRTYRDAFRGFLPGLGQRREWEKAHSCEQFTKVATR